MRQLTLFTATAIALTFATSCASTPSRFYALSATAPASEVAGSTSSLSLAVGPVSVPALVDRPQIVVSTSANQVQLDEFNRWASPLAEEIARVIAANLAQALPSARVWPYGQSVQSTPDYQVRVDVQQFASTLGDAAVIEVLWTLRRVAGGEPKSGRSLVREATTGGDVDALVAAHSRALARVSGDIAAAIRVP
jgi:uncharacterized lipoprotein YmbA